MTKNKNEIRAEIARLVEQYAAAEAAERGAFVPGQSIVPHPESW